jgi:xanthine dehydrogenase YagR molybdenum-binding subunit
MAPVIGEALDRRDGRLKITGGARYAAESAAFSNLAEAVLVQSTIGNGRIRMIDAADAERAPGVIAVMTHLNAPRLNSDGGDHPVQPGEFYPLLQDDRVQYNGQHVAVVVAETFEQATYAAALVKFRYDEEPTVAKLERAAGQAAIPVNFRGGQREADSRRGNPEQAFSGAAIKIDQTYTTPVEHHNPMEPHAVIAAWAGDDLKLYPSTQGISGAQARVAGLLGIPPDNVHVVNAFVGGGFGCKGSTWPHVTLAAMAARLTRRPVRLVLTRRQMFTSTGYRSKTIQHVRLGAGSDGRLVAVIHDGIVQTAPFGEFVEPVGLATEIMYACPNLAVTHRVARINASMPTFMRAPGEASGMFALESAMDELAYAANIDPVQLRLINHADRDEHKNLPWTSKSLKQCYARAAEAFGWAGRSPTPRSMQNNGTLVGWGMASATYPSNRSTAGARVRILPDGTATVQSGTQDIGTGTYTTMTQVAADGLGLPVEKVRAELGDSAFPHAPVSGGSQTSASVLPAVWAAAKAARAKLADLAAGPSGRALQGAQPDDIVIQGDALALQSDPARRVPIRRLLSDAKLPAVESIETAAPGDEEKNYSAHSFGAHFVEVEVEPELAEVRVRRYVGAFAAGRIVNAKTARSQYIGGIVYGLGMALTEETEVDARTGRIVNATIADYMVPVNADVPEITVIQVPEDDTIFNPLGVKGIGELPMVGVAAAIANAVYHATGIRVRDLPVRIDKLLGT